MTLTRRVKQGPGRAAVGQAAEVHGVESSRLDGGLGPAGCGVPRTTGRELVARSHGLSQGGTVKFDEPLDGPPSGPNDQRALPVPGAAPHGHRPAPPGARHPQNRRGDRQGTIHCVPRTSRNQHTDGSYRPFEAHRRSLRRRAKPRPRRLIVNRPLREVVGQLLAQRWSPTPRSLATCGPGSPDKHRCACVTRASPGHLPSRTPDPGACHPRCPRRTRSPLRMGRDHRRARHRLGRRRPRFGRLMLSIHQRPFPPQDRSEVSATGED